MLFTGHYAHTIDSKGRLAIPAEIRARWRSEADGSAWFAVPWPTGCLRLYTEVDFHNRAASRAVSLTPSPDEAELQATLFGLSARVEMDSAGRVRLPDETLKLVGLGTEVVLVGAGDRLEVRDRAEWEKSKGDRLAQMPDLMRRIEERRNGRASGSE